jgi:hypothetical protein
MCSILSIILIVIFVISPLKNFNKISKFMKIIALIFLIYTIYLNNEQINLLKNANQNVKSEELKTQLNMNIICSYIFALFIGLLIIFNIKSFF